MMAPSAYLYPIPIFFLRDAYFHTINKQEEEVWGLNDAGVHFFLIASQWHWEAFTIIISKKVLLKENPTYVHSLNSALN